MNTERPPAEAFATEVVRRLQADGHEAYWAGGCVRDRLQGKQPKDFDVATSASPTQVRALFGRRRTLAVGESFGVIVVRGPRAAGQVEVATFRVDMGYSDGRRPDAVAFRSAEEDAQRRDFTINGMFYDPIADRAIDFVGGTADLRDRIVRAIGDPHQRFFEDKLRMLRGIRFAANLDFELHPETLRAIQQHANDIQVVSIERVANELHRMLTNRHRARAFQLLVTSGLLRVLLPELSELDEEGRDQIKTVLRVLPEVPFALPLAAILRQARHLPAPLEPQRLARTVCQRWRLSNRDSQLTDFLLTRESLVRTARQQPWPRMQRTLIHDDAPYLLQYVRALAEAVGGDTEDIDYCEAKRALPAEDWNPAPLLTGNDLRSMEVPQGKIYREILESLRDEQLIRNVTNRAEAEQFVLQFLAERNSAEGVED